MNTRATQKQSAGGIVYHNGKVLMVHAIDYGEIIFPKGTIEKGETPEETAIREILEETGYHVRIKAPLGDITYEFNENDGKLYQKTVYYFLFELIDENTTPTPNHQEDENFENVWLPGEEALKQLTYDDSRGMLKKAIHYINNRGR